MYIDIPDEQLAKSPFQRLPEDSEEMKYLRERRERLGGPLPQRRANAPSLVIPPLETFDSLLQASGDREFSTTMAFVRILQMLVKDKNIGKNIVPIVPDEARTFGMEGMFRQVGIYSSAGQLYTPQDADQLMFYKEDKKGQILEEGINEGGALASFIAAGTAYANHNVNMIPFYIYYSMFGFQRVGDFIWAAGDSQARGFLLGGTAGRTTLAGEGLQHQDGHSHLAASTIPNCVAYDPTFAYELTVIIQDGLRRMFAEQEDVFYYLSVMNENYAHPAMPKGAEAGILKGMYLLQAGGKGKVRVNLMGSGTILREVLKAAEILEKDYGVPADVFSATSFSEARREALDVERTQHAASGCAAGCAVCAAGVWAIAPGRSSRRRTTCASCPIKSVSGSPDVSSCSAPMVTAAATRAPSFAVTSKWTPRISWWLLPARSRMKASSTWRPSRARSRSSTSIRTNRIRSRSKARVKASMATDIKVPDLGDFKDVEVIDVLVKPGDQVDVDTPLISIETEKATMEVPSPAAGVVASLALKKGDRVSKGSLIGQLEAKGGAAPAAAAPAASEMRAALLKRRCLRRRSAKSNRIATLAPARRPRPAAHLVKLGRVSQ